ACSVRWHRLQRNRPGKRYRRRQGLHRDQSGVGGVVRGDPRPVHARIATGGLMTIDHEAANAVLNGLRPFPVAVTTIDDGFANGLMSLSAGAASIVPELARAPVKLTKYNRTHDMLGNFC